MKINEDQGDYDVDGLEQSQSPSIYFLLLSETAFYDFQE
jgi:hypothetical protein